MKKLLLALFFQMACLAASQAQVIISEIMYNPPGPDTLLEYLEIHNNGNSAVDISNWSFTGINYTFPAGTSFPAGGYIVICANASVANLNSLGVTPRVWINSALTNTGEKLEIKDSNGAVVDVVEYDDASPWPTAAASGGASLVLCNFNSDNSLASNWAGASTATAIVLGGSTISCNPGAASGCSSNPVPTFPLYSINKVTSESPNTGVADSLGVDCTLEGTVYGVNLRGNFGLQFTIIDNTGGIALFSQSKSYGYTVTEGDKVQVRGYVAQFNGLTQLTLDTVIKINAGNPLIAPTTVAKPAEATESNLIKVNSLSLIDPSEWDSTGNPSGFTVRALNSATNDTVTIRIDNNTTLYAKPVPSQPFNATGLGGQFDNSNPYTSGYQLIPRYTADISTFVATKEVDYSNSVKISPNPARDYTLIEMQEKFDKIYLMGLNGQLIQEISKPAQDELIPLRNMEPGTYLIRFEKGATFWSTRLIKQ